MAFFLFRSQTQLLCAKSPKIPKLPTWWSERWKICSRGSWDSWDWRSHAYSRTTWARWPCPRGSSSSVLDPRGTSRTMWSSDGVWGPWWWTRYVCLSHNCQNDHNSQKYIIWWWTRYVWLWRRNINVCREMIYMFLLGQCVLRKTACKAIRVVDQMWLSYKRRLRISVTPS